MKINEVIERHGMQLRDVSREMGMKPSALQSAIDRNLTVKTLRQISEAARIPIAEFFMDELTDEECQQLLAALNPSQPAAESASAGQQQAASGEGGASGLPFGCGEPIPADAPTRSLSAIGQQAIVCPHCHQALVMNIAAYEQK
jgi:lambda repressor-like predicted transcriptional regulator